MSDKLLAALAQELGVLKINEFQFTLSVEELQNRLTHALAENATLKEQVDGLKAERELLHKKTVELTPPPSQGKTPRRAKE